MIAYQLDSKGYYLEKVECQPSPLEEGVYLIPAGSVEIEPPEVSEGYIQRFVNGEWKIEINPQGKTFYNKKDRSEKFYDLGDEIEEDYTDISPLENEMFQNYVNGQWEVDLEKKQEHEKKMLMLSLKNELASSDWRMTIDKFESMTTEQQTYWKSHRQSLRDQINELEGN